MSDIRLFKVTNHKAREIVIQRIALEKEIQTLIERNLEEFFSIRLLATEYATGEKHKGRIDTLGIDENNSPVIIEYKLHTNENVINQGLYYMDWLMDHKAEFDLLVREKLGKKIDIEWQAPRLLCMANDFTKYDSYAVEQINRNIELIRYKNYAEGIVLFELVNAISIEEGKPTRAKSKKGENKYKTNKEYYKQAPTNLKKLWDHADKYLSGLGDDVQKKQLKNYMAYRRLKNFVCMEIKPQVGHLLLYLKGIYKSIDNPPTFVRDVSKIGHYGTGDIEVKIKNVEEFKQIETLINNAYDAG